MYRVCHFAYFSSRMGPFLFSAPHCLASCLPRTILLQDGRTILHVAAMSGHTALVQALLCDPRISPGERHGKGGTDPVGRIAVLEWCACRGGFVVVRSRGLETEGPLLGASRSHLAFLLEA